MSNNKEICDEFLQLARRRSSTHGKWNPIAYWGDKIGINYLTLKRALEKQSMINHRLDDDMHIEFNCRSVQVDGKSQKRWFLCISTDSNPELSCDKDSTQEEFQAAWDEYSHLKGLCEIAAQQQQQSTSTTATEQPTPRPEQPGVASTPRATAVSPTADSPQLTTDDSDLQELFRSIVNPQCLSKADLFRVNAIGIRTKLVAFSKKTEAKNHDEQCQRFYSDKVPAAYSVKDITTLEKDPCLSEKYGIPMSVPAMSEVAQALLNLSMDVPEILQLSKYSGSKGAGKRLVAMLPSSDIKRLYQNAKQWMPDILSAAAIDNNAAEDEYLLTYDIVKTLIKVLLTIDPIAFEDVAAAMSNEASIRSKYKLDAELQQAMMFASGVNQQQMRTIKTHLCYANLDMLQPETEIRKLQVNDFVKPTSIPFKDGGTRTKVAWTVPVNTVLQYKVNKALASNTFAFDNLSHAHVTLVGDHGQGAFRMMATLLLIRRPNRRRSRSPVNAYIGTVKALEVDALIGYVQCKKDTYKVLQDTIATPIEEAICRIRNAGNRVTIYRTQDGAVEFCFGNTHTYNTVLAHTAVEVFMTGDLAFYAIALGKENMAPFWCWRCQSTKKEWTEFDGDGAPLGVLWSLESMQAHLAKIDSGEISKNKPNLVKGITNKAFWSILVMKMLVPPLHNNELFINTPLKALMAWIHHRIENLAMEIIQARQKVIDLMIKCDEAKQELDEANAALPFLTQEEKTLRPKTRRKKGEPPQPVYRDDDHFVEYNATTLVLEEARIRTQEAESDVAKVKKKLDAAKRKVKAVCKKKEHGALSQPVRQRLEELLQRTHNIVRSAYHGGDFEGNHCRKFMRNADAVMDSIEGLLLDVPEVDRSADNEEIRRHCCAFKRLFQHFDALIHCCQQAFGTLTNDDMANVRKLVCLLDRLWRQMFETVPPKAHAWWHLIDDLERLRGLKHHQESKIEVSHQVGKPVDLLFRAVNDIEKKID
mgnify:CR=1 FL=1